MAIQLGENIGQPGKGRVLRTLVHFLATRGMALVDR